MKTKGLFKLLQAGAAAAEVLGSPRFEWQTLQIFLTICLHGGEMPQQELEKQTGWAQSAVSRNIAKLGNGLTVGEQGARLVEAYEDPEWRRRKLVRLTTLGRRVAERLETVMAH